MLKMISISFLSILFLSSLTAQDAPYKRDAGLAGASIVENDKGERFYADKNGKNIFGNKTFRVALAFGCGYAPVQVGSADSKEWVYIDVKGNEIMKFTSAGEADVFKGNGADCKATLWNVVPEKYTGCKAGATCDCIVSDLKRENDASGKSQVLYNLTCGDRKPGKRS
jgi:hypothetical protein